MKSNSNYTWLVVVILLGAFLQIILASADKSETPYRVAIDFAKAYYRLDPGMADYLCEDLKSMDDQNVALAYIDAVRTETQQQGFKLDWAKSRLYSIHTHTVLTSENEAEVDFKAERRKEINPVYAFVAKLFFLGETYPVNETVRLIKENGKWKVCEGFLPIAAEA
jgi:uncharacterized protein YchJ